MRSLLEKAQPYINEAIGSQRPGIALVIPSQNFNRSELVAWTFATAIKTMDGDGPFHALYVAPHIDLVTKAQRAVNKYERPERFADEGIYEPRDGVLPPLRTYNYIGIRPLVNYVGRFTTSQLSLVVVDERAPGRMDEVAKLITSEGSPSFTLVLTKCDPLPGWPWRYLGEPVRIQGSGT